MKKAICFSVFSLLFSTAHAIMTLNFDLCGRILYSGKELYQCDYMRFGDTYNLHDLTGHNQITITPNTFYVNHGKTIGYSGKHALYIEKEQLSKEEWKNFELEADKFAHAKTEMKLSDAEIYYLSDKSEDEINVWLAQQEKHIESNSGLDRNNGNI